jgi:hypothetical protein
MVFFKELEIRVYHYAGKPVHFIGFITSASKARGRASLSC